MLLALYFAAFVLSAFLLAFSSWVPETFISSVLAILSIIVLCALLPSNFLPKFYSKITGKLGKSNKTLFAGLFIFGTSLSLLSNYWIPNTLSLFGGFSVYLSWFLFFLFSCLSSVQYLLLAFLYTSLKKINCLKNIPVHLSIAWFVSETIFPRLFPWKLSMMQIYWENFSALAEIIGTGLLSFLLLFWIESALNFKTSSILSKILFFMSFFSLLLGSSLQENTQNELLNASFIKAGIIQGNISLEDKHGFNTLEDNLKVYQGLSKSAERAGAEIIIWPESVMTEWLPQNLKNLRGERVDPFPSQTLPVLYGGLSYKPKEESEFLRLSRKLTSPRLIEQLKVDSYNSAIYLEKSGEVSDIYHKQVLMPFGEYLPFRDIYPAVRELSPYSGDFAAGEETIVFSGHVPGKDFKFSVLICYEDMISWVSAESAKNGANFLVNISNDAWYGKSVASKQHHLLAMWRSIETRRALLRVTNNGLTAIVSPMGKTQQKLKRFREDFMVVEVPLLYKLTLFVKYGVGNFTYKLSWILVIFIVSLMLISRGRRV